MEKQTTKRRGELRKETLAFHADSQKQRQGHVLLALLSSSFISSVLNSNFDVPGNNEHAFLSSSFIFPLEAFSDEPLFPAVCIGTNERIPWLLFQSGSAAASRGSRR
ncbi:uncharacterized protein TrAtP1_000452 [Trichoderma atroviride]|uniref:uncharacterized protein n=1 Tax=Hypocrea atroviridis TaxID=63577 RepID=UPI00333276FD|nr:hypothetical protein TrAtP1_000452 [Trichoderma atroviride]